MTILDNHRQPLSPSAKMVPASAASKVTMVIGSTGFLGPYIVASLLSENTMHDILCVNRGNNGQERTIAALQEIRRGDSTGLSRLRFFVADITRPHLGLTRAQVEEMGTDIDEIVFNAWNPNWGLPLEKFDPLLRAVQNAIDFSLSNAKLPRITFISSICAIGEWPRNHPDQPNIPEDVVQDCADAMANAYAESKCVAELLLAQASSASKLEVAIVRAGQIGGTSLSSMTPSMWPIQGWIYSIISASRKSKHWPTHVQPLDWIPVDALAKGIATIVSSQRSNKEIQVYNMVHPKPAPWSLLLATLQDRFGLVAREVGLPQWLDLFDPETMKLFNFLRVGGCGREYDMVFDNENAAKVLPGLAPITMEQLEYWLMGWGLGLEEDKQAKL
jgi:thioester reductase-like protein